MSEPTSSTQETAHLGGAVGTISFISRLPLEVAGATFTACDPPCGEVNGTFTCQMEVGHRGVLHAQIIGNEVVCWGAAPPECRADDPPRGTLEAHQQATADLCLAWADISGALVAPGSQLEHGLDAILPFLEDALCRPAVEAEDACQNCGRVARPLIETTTGHRLCFICDHLYRKIEMDPAAVLRLFGFIRIDGRSEA